eukprot:5352271-Pleurochrysis_carterae.AAC.3
MEVNVRACSVRLGCVRISMMTFKECFGAPLKLQRNGLPAAFLPCLASKMQGSEAWIHIGKSLTESTGKHAVPGSDHDVSSTASSRCH